MGAADKAVAVLVALATTVVLASAYGHLVAQKIAALAAVVAH